MNIYTSEYNEWFTLSVFSKRQMAGHYIKLKRLATSVTHLTLSLWMWLCIWKQKFKKNIRIDYCGGKEALVRNFCIVQQEMLKRNVATSTACPARQDKIAWLDWYCKIIILFARDKYSKIFFSRTNSWILKVETRGKVSIAIAHLCSWRKWNYENSVWSYLYHLCDSDCKGLNHAGVRLLSIQHICLVSIG